MTLRKFERYFKGVITGRKKGMVPWFIKKLLLPASWGYRTVVECRNWLYDHGWMRCYVPPIPLVISVGNLVVGGTGKTPVTMLLANAFYPNYHLAILSRGYRSKAEKLETPIVLCEGEGPMYPASYCGDEPYLFALRFPKAHVIVGSNRKKASCLASKAGAQVILLDDALQHRGLARDFDVIVMDLNDPFGQNYFLPRGLLREDHRALKRADCVILNHVGDGREFKEIERVIKQHTNAPVVGTHYAVTAVRDLKGQEVASLKGQTAGMFCSIANPENFKRLLENEGVWIGAELFLADHDEIKEKTLESFTRQCIKKGCEFLVCTEKDRVKLKDELTLDLPIVWIQVELKIVEGQQEWQSFIKKAAAKIF